MDVTGNAWSRMKLSVIVPAYNERGTILELLKEVQSVPIEKEIIVLDGCSTDGTREILESLKSPGIRVIFEDVRRGKGAAVRRGFQEASGDYVLVQDADLELSPKQYPDLLEPIRQGHAQVVYGSRLLSGKNPFPAHTLFANRFLALLTNWLYGSQLTDIETGFKLLPTALAKRMPLESDGFDLDPEITVQLLRLGYRIHEVPVAYTPRGVKDGKKIRWSDAFKALKILLFYRFTRVRLRD